MIPSRGRSLPTILYIDADPTNHLAMQAAFRGEFHIIGCAGLKDAWARLAKQEIQAVIAHYRLATLSGIEVLERIRKRYPRIPRVLVTAYSNRRLLVHAINRAGISHLIEKPWERETMRQALLEVLASHRANFALVSENHQLMETNRQLEFALRQALIS